MPERPAPLILVTTPPEGQPFGSHAAIAADGQRLLATSLSHRLGHLGAAARPLAATAALAAALGGVTRDGERTGEGALARRCLLYTSDAAAE